MKSGKPLLIVDAFINLFLGIVLLSYSRPVVDFFGLPDTSLGFYPNILGAVLFGIGVALIIELKNEGSFRGLGLGGAIAINIIGGIVLFIWLVSGVLDIPPRGFVILWAIDMILIGISSFELIVLLRNRR